MSYAITFSNIPEEEIKKFEISTNYCTPENVKLNRLEIIYKCMKFKETFAADIYTFTKAIKFNLNCILNYQTNLAKKHIYESYMAEDEYDPKGQLTFEGSKFRGIFEYNSSEDILNDVTEQLFILAAFTSDYDYFDESEKWSEKYNAISEQVDYFIKSVYDNVYFDFKSTYYKYSDECKEHANDLDNV